MHIVLATDVDWIVDEITAALSGPDTSFTVCREGRVVVDVVAEREPDLAILDLQIGSKGGMAVTMALRLDESAGMLPHVQVIMLLDRRADVFLARRSGAEGWLIKPLDPLRIKRAVTAVMTGGTYFEGVSVPTSNVPEVEVGAADALDVDDVAAPTPTIETTEDELASPTIETTEDELASPTIENGEPAPAG